MGWTHYWRRPEQLPPAEFAAAVSDYKKCLPALKAAGINLAGPDGTGEPMISDELVEFNGKRPASCELFYFEQTLVPFRWRRQPDDEEQGGVFGYCKTEGVKTYGLAVLAFLIIARRHFEDLIKFESDGKDVAIIDAGLFVASILGPAKKI